MNNQPPIVMTDDEINQIIVMSAGIELIRQRVDLDDFVDELRYDISDASNGWDYREREDAADFIRLLGR